MGGNYNGAGEPINMFQKIVVDKKMKCRRIGRENLPVLLS